MSKKNFEYKGKTQKNKLSISSKEKKKLWELYDIDKKEEEDIECVYEKSPKNNVENTSDVELRQRIRNLINTIEKH